MYVKRVGDVIPTRGTDTLRIKALTLIYSKIICGKYLTKIRMENVKYFKRERKEWSVFSCIRKQKEKITWLVRNERGTRGDETFHKSEF